MPELENREARERRQALALMLVLNAFGDDFSDYGRFSAVEMQSELEDTLQDHLRRTYSAAYLGMRKTFTDAPKIEGMRERGEIWSRRYAGIAAAKMTATTQVIISDLRDRGFDREMIARRAFSRSRANATAVSDITDAVSAAEFDTTSRWAKLGMKTVAYWDAHEDELTCEVCGDLNGKPFSYWRRYFPSGPKAHIHCRCRIQWRVIRA